MKRILWFAPAMLLFCAAVRAQEAPRVEVSGGYSFLDANLGGPTFHLNGGYVSATENLNDWFGGRVEFHGYAGTESGAKVTADTITYSPVFTYRRFNRFTPYAEVGVGAMHGGLGYLGISRSAFHFALTSGGGVDINVGSRTAIRVQANYLMSRFLGLRQDNIQVSTGLVFRFGSRQTSGK